MEQPEHRLQQGPWPWGLCGAQGRQDPTEEATGTRWDRRCWALTPWLGGCSRTESSLSRLTLGHCRLPRTGTPWLPLLTLLGRMGWGSWLQPLLTAAPCHCSSAPGHSLPPEVLPHCFIEFDIIRSIKVPKLLDHLGVYLHVSPALGLAQAARQAAAL